MAKHVMDKRVIPMECKTAEACGSCDIRQSVLFADLTTDELNSIHLPIEDITLAKGEIIYRQGQTASALFTIREGLVKLEQYLEDGNYRIVSLLGPGDLIGLEASLSSAYEHTAVALLTGKVCRIPRDVVSKMSAQINGQLMNKWHDMVKRSHQCALELSTGSARQRMARLFLLLAGPTEQSFQLFAREDVGALLGITTETACRLVSTFKKQQIIREVKSSTYAFDAVSLHEIARGN